MESVDPFDKWLDPPDFPTHSECSICGNYFYNEDLDDCYCGKLLCRDCWPLCDCNENPGTDELERAYDLGYRLGRRGYSLKNPYDEETRNKLHKEYECGYLDGCLKD